MGFGATTTADSIVYVDGGNVFSASPDGSTRVQLTDGGDWHSPTQSDDGTIAAVKGTGPIHVMARDGRPLRTIATKEAMTADGGWFDYGAATRVVFFAVSGDPRSESPPAQPTVVCSTDDGDPKHGDPSWSPDGSGVAFDTSGAASAAFRLSATGSKPDWGAADPPAARWVRAPPAPPAPSNPAPPAGPGAVRAPPAGAPAARGPATGSGVRFTLPRVTVAALRRGLTVKVTAPAAGRVTVTLRRRRATIASGSIRARRVGSVSIRLGSVAAKHAARLAGARLTLTVGAGGRTATRTVRVR